MNDNSSNPNIEWKKTGFGTSEKLSRRINAKEATTYQAQKKRNFQQASQLSPSNLPGGIKKLRKKIKDVFDEDEEDEDEYISSPFPSLNEDNSLLNALNEDERKYLKQKGTLQQIRMQQDAGKLEALSLAHQMAQDAGVNGLRRKTIEQGMLASTVDNNSLKQMIKNDLAQSLKLRTDNIPDGRYIQVLRGLQNIRKIGGIKAIEGLNLSEVAEATDEKKAAKVLLEKTGRDEYKNKKIKSKTPSQAMKKRPTTPKKNLSFHLLDDKSQSAHG